jgi:hypothetical protein
MNFKFAKSFAAAAVAVSALMVSAQAHADTDTFVTSGTFAGTTGSIVLTDLLVDTKASFVLMTADPVITSFSLFDLSSIGQPAINIDNLSFLNTYGGDTAAGADVVSASISKLLAGHDYKISWTTTAGADYELHGSLSPISSAVPEPESISLVLGGLGVAGFALRRRQRVQA